MDRCKDWFLKYYCINVFWWNLKYKSKIFYQEQKLLDLNELSLNMKFESLKCRFPPIFSIEFSRSSFKFYLKFYQQNIVHQTSTSQTSTPSSQTPPSTPRSRLSRPPVQEDLGHVHHQDVGLCGLRPSRPRF